MSIKLMSLVWEVNNKKLTGIEKSILIRLADFAADNGTQIFPSISKISADTGFCIRTVKTTLKNLAAKNVLTKSPRFIDGKQTSNIYSINVLLLCEWTKPIEEIKEIDGGAADARGGCSRCTGWVQQMHTDPSLDPPLDKKLNKKEKRKEKIVKECQKAVIPTKQESKLEYQEALKQIEDYLDSHNITRSLNDYDEQKSYDKNVSEMALMLISGHGLNDMLLSKQKLTTSI